MWIVSASSYPDGKRFGRAEPSGAFRKLQTDIRARQILGRRLRPDGQALHEAALPGVGVDGIMLGAAIIPYRQRPRRPADAAGEFGTHRMVGEVVDQRLAFVLGHVFEADRMAAVEVKRLAPGSGMRANDGMDRFDGGCIVGALNLHAADIAVPAGPSAGALEARAVDAGEATEQGAHTVGQRLVSQVLVGEERVAAMARRLLGIEQRAERRAAQIGRVGVPGIAEILGLMRLLDDLEDLRMAVETPDEGVVARLAEAASDCHEVVERECLVAEDDDEMVEEGAMDFRARLVDLLAREVDPRDLGAERAGQRPHLDLLVTHVLPSAFSF